MRFWWMSVLIPLLAGCYNREQHQDGSSQADKIKPLPDTLHKETIRPITEQAYAHERIKYSDKRLEAFLDSVGRLETKLLRGDAGYFEDSVFRSRKQFNKKLSYAQKRSVKDALKKGKMLLRAAHEIFPAIDTSFVADDSVFVTSYLFSKGATSLPDYFALCVGYPSAVWENDVYFFRNDVLVAWHHIFHKGGLSIDHFSGENGEPVIFYKQNFGSGTGFWQYNYFFYHYTNGRLAPLLNVLENANLNAFSGRHFWYEARLIRKVPLTFKIVYQQALPDTSWEYKTIVDDSLVAKWEWKDQVLSTSAMPDQNRLLTYSVEASEAFVLNVYYKQLNSLLLGADQSKKNAVLFYLQHVLDDK